MLVCNLPDGPVRVNAGLWALLSAASELVSQGFTRLDAAEPREVGGVATWKIKRQVAHLGLSFTYENPMPRVHPCTPTDIT